MSDGLAIETHDLVKQYGKVQAVLPAPLRPKKAVICPLGTRRLSSLDLLDVMVAFHMPYFSGRDTCFVAYLPWGTLSVIVLIGFAIIALATQVVERQDF